MKISLIIPTRSRAKYLRSSLLSAVVAAEHAACDVEIVVVDNASDDDTADVVRGFTQPCIRYFRQPRRVSMRQNFEDALNYSTGSHIVIIGDDDGVLPNGLAFLRRLIEAEDCEIYKWQVLNYFWPNSETGEQGRLSVRPLRLSGRLAKIDPQSVLESFFRGRFTSYHDGGMIYHGCIARRLVERVRARSNGVYFWTSCPDVYTSIANVMATNSKILSAHLPVTIGGASPRSNGASASKYSQSAHMDANSEYAKFLAESRTDPCLGEGAPLSSSLDVVVLSALLTASKFQKLSAIDRNAWAKRIARGLRTVSDDIARAVADDVRLVLGPDVVLDLDRPRSTSSSQPAVSRPRKHVASPSNGTRVRNHLVNIRFSSGAATENVANAAQLLDTISDLDSAGAHSQTIVELRRIIGIVSRAGFGSQGAIG